MSEIKIHVDYIINQYEFPLFVMPWEQDEEVLHSHDFYELVIVTHGRGIHILKDDQYNISKGDTFVIPPGIAHKYRNTRNLEIINVLYVPEMLDLPIEEFKHISGYKAFFEIAPKFMEIYKYKNRLSMSHMQLDRVLLLVHEIAEEIKLKRPKFELAVKAAFTLLLYHISRICECNSENVSHSLLKLNETVKYINDNFHRDLTVDDIAAEVNMSRSSLNRLFAKNFKTSI